MDLDFLVEGVTEREIIPVVGNDLSLVKDEENNPVPLYNYIAKNVAAELKIPYNSQSIHELALTVNGIKSQHVYEKVKSIYKKIKKQNRIINDPLKILSKILDFDFYISTAIDDLLEDALKVERTLSDEDIGVINYSLKTKNEVPKNTKVVILKIMGALSPIKNSAIDDEKMLENLISITNWINEVCAAGNSISDFFSGTKGFLFIGCDYPDWLMRFLIRILTNKRLIEIDRFYNDHIVSNYSDGSSKLKNFLVHCRKDFVEVSENGNENVVRFVEEFYGNWAERKTFENNLKYKGKVFLSYNKMNKPVIIDIKNSFKNERIDVWFDEDNLHSGLHEEEIPKIIDKCPVFIPFISDDILKKPECYAQRVEWRTIENIFNYKHGILHQRLEIFPCIIDDVKIDDERIPKLFRSYKIYIYSKEKDKLINRIRSVLKQVGDGDE